MPKMLASESTIATLCSPTSEPNMSSNELRGVSSVTAHQGLRPDKSSHQSVEFSHTFSTHLRFLQWVRRQQQTLAELKCLPSLSTFRQQRCVGWLTFFLVETNPSKSSPASERKTMTSRRSSKSTNPNHFFCSESYTGKLSNLNFVKTWKG